MPVCARVGPPFSLLVTDPVFEYVLEDAFVQTFSQEICKNAWSKGGAALLTIKCLSGSKVTHKMEYYEKEDTVYNVYHNIQQKNDMCVHNLLSIRYNSNVLSSKLKEKTKSVRASLTVPHL